MERIKNLKYGETNKAQRILFGEEKKELKIRNYFKYAPYPGFVLNIGVRYRTPTGRLSKVFHMVGMTHLEKNKSLEEIKKGVKYYIENIKEEEKPHHFRPYKLKDLAQIVGSFGSGNHSVFLIEEIES